MPAVKKRKKAEPVTLNNKSNSKAFSQKHVYRFGFCHTVCAYDSRFRSYEGFAVR